MTLDGPYVEVTQLSRWIYRVRVRNLRPVGSGRCNDPQQPVPATCGSARVYPYPGYCVTDETTAPRRYGWVVWGRKRAEAQARRFLADYKQAREAETWRIS